jgi:hypothetical protein
VRRRLLAMGPRRLPRRQPGRRCLRPWPRSGGSLVILRSTVRVGRRGIHRHWR